MKMPPKRKKQEKTAGKYRRAQRKRSRANITQQEPRTGAVAPCECKSGARPAARPAPGGDTKGGQESVMVLLG